MRYEVFGTESGYGYRIINDNEVTIAIQEFEPWMSGFAPMSEERAEELAQATVDEYTSRPDPQPEETPKTPEQIRIEQLEDENAMMALEVATANIRLDQAEQAQADLMLTLVLEGVL